MMGRMGKGMQTTQIADEGLKSIWNEDSKGQLLIISKFSWLGCVTAKPLIISGADSYQSTLSAKIIGLFHGNITLSTPQYTCVTALPPPFHSQDTTGGQTETRK